MTTDTIERTDIDFEAWLQREIETPCEVNIGPSGSPGRYRCGRPAEWLMRGTKPCEHIPNPELLFICQHCRNYLSSGKVFLCDTCNGEVFTTWIERIKA